MYRNKKACKNTLWIGIVSEHIRRLAKMMKCAPLGQCHVAQFESNQQRKNGRHEIHEIGPTRLSGMHTVDYVDES